MNDKLLPLGDDRIGVTPDGPIGPPEARRPRLELWKRQQAALERGEDPTKIEDLIEINAEVPAKRFAFGTPSRTGDDNEKIKTNRCCR